MQERMLPSRWSRRRGHSDLYLIGPVTFVDFDVGLPPRHIPIVMDGTSREATGAASLESL
eukprot:scaffold363261_cov47-Attheya_sp.AAC.2